MDDELYLCHRIADERVLCISTLSRKSFLEAGGEAFGNDRGYFLYEKGLGRRGDGIEILAKVASIEAAWRLAAMWGLTEAEVA